MDLRRQFDTCLMNIVTVVTGAQENIILNIQHINKQRLQLRRGRRTQTRGTDILRKNNTRSL